MYTILILYISRSIYYTHTLARVYVMQYSGEDTTLLFIIMLFWMKASAKSLNK